MVLPAVLGEILRRILYVERYTDLEDKGDWRSRWLRFTTLLPGVAKPPEDIEQAETNDIDDWIDEAISSFCRRHRIMDYFTSFWTGEVTI
jgi:hypothetical protein